MAKNIGNNVLSPQQTAIYKGCDEIDANTRYFLLRKHVPNEHGLTFKKGVNLIGVLANLRDQCLIHEYNNKVQYLKEEKDDDGNTK